MSACKGTKILAFTSMEIPTNTNIHKRLTIAINDYKGAIKRLHGYKKRLHLALQNVAFCCNLLPTLCNPFSTSG